MADPAQRRRIGKERYAVARRSDALHFARNFRPRGCAQKQVDAGARAVAETRQHHLALEHDMAGKLGDHPSSQRGSNEARGSRGIEAHPGRWRRARARKKDRVAGAAGRNAGDFRDRDEDERLSGHEEIEASAAVRDVRFHDAPAEAAEREEFVGAGNQFGVQRRTGPAMGHRGERSSTRNLAR